MKLAIDFGTSYSAAAFLKQGQVELVRFGDDHQFRAAVFFPAKIPSVANFKITVEIEREIAKTVQQSKSEQTRDVQRIEGLRKEARKRTPSDRAQALDMIPEVSIRTDDEFHREALKSTRRARSYAMTAKMVQNIALWAGLALLSLPLQTRVCPIPFIPWPHVSALR